MENTTRFDHIEAHQTIRKLQLLYESCKSEMELTNRFNYTEPWNSSYAVWQTISSTQNAAMSSFYVLLILIFIFVIYRVVKIPCKSKKPPSVEELVLRTSS